MERKSGRGAGIPSDGQPLSRETQRSVGRPLAALTNFLAERERERNKILVLILEFRVDAPFKSTESNYG